MAVHHEAEMNAYSHSETLTPAKVILDTQEGFVVDTRKIVHASDDDHFTVRELCNLEQIVQELCEDVELSQSKWIKNRHKASRHVQSFATKFSAFLESYSGIVEIVKGADQQYGGLAYGTLSMFLIVRLHC